MKHLPLGAEARRLIGMGGSMASIVVVTGLLTAACSSSAGSAASTSSVTATQLTVTANWSTVDINKGAITLLPPSAATSGSFYAVSPDHTKVAYNACCSWSTPVLVANLDGTHAHQISAPGWDGMGEQWSPDGSLLVYQQRDSSTDRLGNLFVQNIATRQRTRVTNLDHKQWGWWFTYPSFSSDGKSILFQRPKGPNGENRNWDLWSVPVTGGKPTLVQRNAAWGSYSPDGKRLAYLSPIDEGDFTGSGLWIKNVQGGTPKALVRHGSLRSVRWSPDGTRIAYSNGSAIYVVNAATGSTRKIGPGGNPEWLNDHRLILVNS